MLIHYYFCVIHADCLILNLSELKLLCDHLSFFSSRPSPCSGIF